MTLDTRKRKRDQHSSAQSLSFQIGTKPVKAPFGPHVNPVSTLGRISVESSLVLERLGSPGHSETTENTHVHRLIEILCLHSDVSSEGGIHNQRERWLELLRTANELLLRIMLHTMKREVSGTSTRAVTFTSKGEYRDLR